LALGGSLICNIALNTALIGTLISFSYPAEKRALQERIARDGLPISQVPVKRWQ